MKKKFLSLMMAAAMVATTSISAFASEAEANVTSTTPYEATGKNTVNVSSDDKVGKEAQVQIQGDIAKNDGTFAPNTMNITVPTNARFAVDKEGNLTGSNIVIKSEGVDPVSVIAYKFVDRTPNDKITVVSNQDLTQSESGGQEANTRKKVTLTLQGNTNTAYLKSETEKNKTGIYKNENGTLQPVESSEDFVLGNVESGTPLTLSLRGTAGTKGDRLTTAEQDNFTLILKFKKENK